MHIILWLLTVMAVCALVGAFVFVPVLKALLEGTPPQGEKARLPPKESSPEAGAG